MVTSRWSRRGNGNSSPADRGTGAAGRADLTGGEASGILADPRSSDDGTCRFSFRLAGLPTGQDSYVVTVAEQEPRQYTEPELAGALASLRLD